MLSAVKRIMREACEHNLIDAGAAYKFEKTKGASFTLLKNRMKHARSIPISKGQMQALCNLPDTSTLLGLRDKALLYTLVTSGICASEAADLLTSRIFKVSGGYIIQLMGKRDIEYRDAPLSPDGYMLIQEWLLKRGVDNAYVFTCFITFGEMPITHKLSAKAVWDVVKHYAGQAGLEHISPHSFCRYVGAEVVKLDGIRTAQTALGHKNINTTASHYDQSSLKVGITDNLI